MLSNSYIRLSSLCPLARLLFYGIITITVHPQNRCRTIANTPVPKLDMITPRSMYQVNCSLHTQLLRCQRFSRPKHQPLITNPHPAITRQCALLHIESHAQSSISWAAIFSAFNLLLISSPSLKKYSPSSPLRKLWILILWLCELTRHYLKRADFPFKLALRS